MSDVILKVENLSKQYRLGTISTGTVSHDLNRWWSRIRGKEDPYLRVGETNDRSFKGESEYVWALKDINLEVKRGEVLGIIGKNGAGKSTLLKILSQVTSPTTGSIKTRGRIASLLEVGTGFHPEMTGRENIFLNGAILGMTKKEIRLKLDEIIEFSGCERYIDTPVKRYSSGMKVRLAFAVAAFLEPDILVVDEVLAVGDAEFQKKAIGKMQDISRGEGRTVLFVSHDMGAIRGLCEKCLIIDKGQIFSMGETTRMLQIFNDSIKSKLIMESIFPKGVSIGFDGGKRFKEVLIGGNVKLRFKISNTVRKIEFGIYNDRNTKLAHFSTLSNYQDIKINKGEIIIENLPFDEGEYFFNVLLTFYSGTKKHFSNICTLWVVNNRANKSQDSKMNKGLVYLDCTHNYE